MKSVRANSRFFVTLTRLHGQVGRYLIEHMHKTRRDRPALAEPDPALDNHYLFPGDSTMHQTIRFTLNSTPVSITVDRERPLLWVLRHDLALTGTKYGCGQGLCGSCTVLIDGIAVRSCQTTVGEAADREILTIEGLADGNDLHPVQRSFVEHDALQCGYCTPGMILQATSLLKHNPNPGRDEIIDAMENNLCRCGAHNRIIQAIEAAAEKLNGGG